MRKFKLSLKFYKKLHIDDMQILFIPTVFYYHVVGGNLRLFAVGIAWLCWSAELKLSKGE